jgi:hypothetical protein
MSDSIGLLPLIIYEAELALYTLDSLGDPLEEVFLGACPEGIAMSDPFRSVLIEYHGEAHRREHHEEDEHFITLSNVRAVSYGDGGGSAPRVPTLRKNVRYGLVIVWWDPEKLVWIKRSYFSVTASGGPEIDPSNVTQSIRLRAEELVETAGRGSKPDLSPVRTGQVIYVSGDERTPLFEYDPGDGSFTLIDSSLLSGRGLIDLSEPTVVSVTVESTLAMTAAASGITLASGVSFVGLGGSFNDDDPRLEFWVGNVRLAALSATKFAAPDFEETAVEPTSGLGRFMTLKNTGWLSTIGQRKTYAPGFGET